MQKWKYPHIKRLLSEIKQLRMKNKMLQDLPHFTERV